MGNTLSNLLYHTIFSTKDRKAFINDDIAEELYRYMGGIIKGEDGKLFQIGGMPDHIHIFFKLKPVHTLSQMMMRIKGKSSKWINEKKLLPQRFSWQDGYGAFTVSQSQVEIVIHYIKNQVKHHQKMSFKEEFLLMLKRHHIEYDDQYLW